METQDVTKSNGQELAAIKKVDPQGEFVILVPEPQKVVRETEPSQPEMAMIRLAIDKGAPIETIERLVALQEKMLARQAEIEFNEALNRVQSKIARVAPDLTNSQTSSKYASYAAIDRVIRPIYSEEGFSLSFSEEDCPKPEHVRIICFVSKGAHTRQYRKDMPSDGKGAKGGDVMTKTHAAAAADSYAKRYLVKDIFNVAIGQDDTDGNVSTQEASDFIAHIQDSANLQQLEQRYKEAIKDALQKKSPKAIEFYMKAREKRERELA